MFDAPPEAPLTIDETEQCITQVAEHYDLPKRLILAVLKVEGGRVGQTVNNTNGTYDMGPMQINSIWLEHFSDYVSREEIIYDGCININVGAWLLRSQINQAGGDFWKGVGNYHSKTPHLHRTYVQKVYTASLELP